MQRVRKSGHPDEVTVTQDTTEKQAQLLTLESGFAFAYWKIDDAALESGISRLGPTTKLFLRFYDVTPSLDVDRAASWDTQIFDREGNWYLKLERVQQKLCFDVILKNRNDQFVRLARSNVTRLPKGFLNRRTPFTGDVEPPPSFEEVLGPYFFNLYKAGHLNEITTSSLSALFQDVTNLKPRRATA